MYTWYNANMYSIINRSTVNYRLGLAHLYLNYIPYIDKLSV